MPASGAHGGNTGRLIGKPDPEKLKNILWQLELNLRLCVCLVFELGFDLEEAAEVLGVSSREAGLLAEQGLRQLHHLLAAEGIERLPREIGRMLGRIPLPPIPERLKVRLEEIILALYPSRRTLRRTGTLGQFPINEV